MTDKPKWQVLQEEYNSLVPAAIAAGIPRVRVVKLGPESIKYREEKIASLKSQLRAAGADDAPPVAESANTSDSIIVPTPRQQIRAVMPRPDLPLRNFDVTVTFEDGTSEVIKTSSRDILSAIQTGSVVARRDWSAERLTSIASITWVVV